MGILAMVFLVIIAIHHVISETENVSINTSDDVPTTTEEDLIAIAKRFEVDEYEEAGDIIPMMFTRGKTPARIKWGRSDYTRREQKQLVEAHNAYRKGVTPSSSDMNEIVSMLRIFPWVYVGLRYVCLCVNVSVCYLRLYDCLAS